MSCCWLAGLLVLCLPRAGQAGPQVQAAYPFAQGPPAGDLLARFPAPAGAERVPVKEGSFAAWLRHLPLLPAGTAVHLYDGRPKERQDVHAAVVDLDVGTRDLQQCADAVMRLRAEYLFAAGRPAHIRFHPDPGRPRVLAFTGGPDRARFRAYLTRLFAEAGSASLQAELAPVGEQPVLAGDVLIQGGYPGHAVLVLDVAQARDGHRYLLLGQSYMPAQQFHVLLNPGDPARSPWYDATALGGPGLATPEWRPFHLRDVRRFPGESAQLDPAQGGDLLRWAATCEGCRVQPPPPEAGPGPWPLVVALHGDGGSPRQMVELLRGPAGQQGVLLFAPRCPKAAGCSEGNWWRCAGSPEWLLRQVEALARAYPVDRQRISLLAWSGGASYLSLTLGELPPLFRAVALAGGGMAPRGGCQQRPVPIYYLSGERNPLRALAEETRDRLQACGHAVQWVTLPGADHGAEWRALEQGQAGRMLSFLAAQPDAR